MFIPLRVILRAGLRFAALIVFFVASVVLTLVLAIRLVLVVPVSLGVVGELVEAGLAPATAAAAAAEPADDPVAAILLSSAIAGPAADAPRGSFVERTITLPRRDVACIVRLAGDPSGTAATWVDDRLRLSASRADGSIWRWTHDFREPGGRIASLPPADLPGLSGDIRRLRVVLDDLEAPRHGSSPLWLLPCANHERLANGGQAAPLPTPAAPRMTASPAPATPNRALPSPTALPIAVAGATATPVPATPTATATATATEPGTAPPAPAAATPSTPAATSEIDATPAAIGATAADEPPVVRPPDGGVDVRRIVVLALAALVLAPVAVLAIVRPRGARVEAAPVDSPVAWVGELRIDDPGSLAHVQEAISSVDLPLGIARDRLRLVPADDPAAVVGLMLEPAAGGMGRVVRCNLAAEGERLLVHLDGIPVPEVAGGEEPTRDLMPDDDDWSAGENWSAPAWA